MLSVVGLRSAALQCLTVLTASGQLPPKGERPPKSSKAATTPRPVAVMPGVTRVLVD